MIILNDFKLICSTVFICHILSFLFKRDLILKKQNNTSKYGERQL